MKAATHKLSGVAAAAFFYWLSTEIHFPHAPDMAVGVLLGCTAPDWLEVPQWGKDGVRKSLIPHRSITHWIVAWSFLLSLAALWPSQSFLKFVIVGFSFGGLMHCMLDATTPMRVPLILPWRRKRVKNRRHK